MLDKNIDIIQIFHYHEDSAQESLRVKIDNWKKTNPSCRVVDFKIVPSRENYDNIYIIYVETNKKKLLTELNDTN